MKSLNLMKVVLLCFSAFMLHALEGQGKGYYVSAAAGDGGDGTHVRPFKDIQAAATLAEAGDTVYVTGGLYVVEGLKPGLSGSEGRFVVFCPLPGTGEVVVQHPDVLPGDYSAVFDLSGLKYVWIGGFTFRDFKYAKCAVSMNGSEECVVSRCRFERLGHPEVAAWNANSVIWMGNARGNSVVDNVFEDIIGDGVSINGQQCNGNLVARNSFTRFSGKKRSWGGESLSHGASTCRICRTGTMPLPSIILQRCLPAFGSIATEAATYCSGTGRMPAGILYSMSRGVRKTWCRKI